MALLREGNKRRLQRIVLAELLSEEIDDMDEEEENQATGDDHPKRKIWMKPWLKARDALDGPTLLYKEVQDSDLDKFSNTFRMTPEMLQDLLHTLGPRITKQDTMFRKSIGPEKRLMVTLRYLTSGANFHVLEDIFRIHHSTISKIVPEVCNAIWDCLSAEYVKCPTTAQEWRQKVKRFEELWNYPRGLGAIDGKHVVVQAFGNTGSTFRNYKNSFSIVLLAVADADYEIIFADIGTQGASNDAGIFNRSDFKTAMQGGQLQLPTLSEGEAAELDVPHHFVVDDAFGLCETMLKPYPLRNMTPKQQVFNYRLSRARRCVENAFGIMTSRFRVLRTPIMQNYSNAVSTAKAIVVLHNYLLCNVPTMPSREVDVAREEEAAVRRPQSAAVRGAGTGVGNLYRERLAEYFFTRGQVDFQWEQTFRTQ